MSEKNSSNIEKMPCDEGIFSFRWQNFRCFDDTKWVDIKPLTIFIGANNTGKSSLFYPLLILKQTIESKDMKLALKTKGRYVNVGNFTDLIFNHEVDKELKLKIRYHYHKKSDTKKGTKISDSPPGAIYLIFRQNQESGKTILSEYEVRDVFDNFLVRRKLGLRDNYNLNFFRKISKEDKNRFLYKIIIKDKPIHFIFEGRTIFNQLAKKYVDTHYGKKSTKKEKKKKPSRESKVTIKFTPDDLSYLIPAFDFASSQIKSLLYNIKYIGPIRKELSRYYEIKSEIPYSVGPKGEFTADILYHTREGKSLEDINRWLNFFGVDGNLVCKPSGSEHFSILLKNQFGTEINMLDMGFGLSQILPLITQGILMKDEETLIAEQPEIHLNPRLQLNLADFFVDLVTKSKKRVIIETHSEYLLLRLRTLIASKKIKPSDIFLYFIEFDNSKSSISKIPIEGNGHIKGKNWPNGFFNDNLRESYELAQHQAK